MATLAYPTGERAAMRGSRRSISVQVRRGAPRDGLAGRMLRPSDGRSRPDLLPAGTASAETKQAQTDNPGRFVSAAAQRAAGHAFGRRHSSRAPKDELKVVVGKVCLEREETEIIA